MPPPESVAPSPAAPPPPHPEPAPHFEGALTRLESIVQRMETDRLSLDELLACYEEGTRLVKACDDFLSAAEQRIELITRDAEGTPRPVPFDPAAASPETPAPSAASAPAPGEDSARPSHEVSLF